MSSRDGFTFVEILLVVILLGVVATISIPSFVQSYTKIQLENTAQDVAYLMRYAQSRAISRNQKVRFIFDESFKQYQLLETVPDAEQEKFRSIAGRFGQAVTVPAEIAVHADKLAVDFSATGEIEKILIRVCREQECLLVSTQEQRGRVEILEEKKY